VVVGILSTVAPAASQESSIRVARTVDDVTGRADTRVIVVADSQPALTGRGSPSDYKGATLIVACGNRVPADSGRTLLLYAGQAFEPFGEGLAYAEVRFDTTGAYRKMDLPIFDYGESVETSTAGRASRHMAYFGTSARPYYSEGFLKSLLAAGTFQVRYRAFGAGWRNVNFRLDGLRASLQSVRGCRWPLE
jgi:hypothetical protein